MEDGNIFLEDYRITYNEKFDRVPCNTEDAHRKILSHENINKICTIQETRKLSKDLSFQYNGIIYQIKEKNPSWSMKYSGISILDDGSGIIQIEYQGRNLKYAKWSNQPSQGKIVDSKTLNWTLRKKYKPSKKHPWR